jgi:protein SCO1/2
VANILTYCYRYDPQTDKHSLMVVRAVQLGGIVTVASLGSFIFLMFRRDIQLAREQDTPQPGKKKTGEMDKG